MSSSFPPLEAWPGLLRTRLGIGVSVALLLHAGVLLGLASRDASSPRSTAVVLPTDTPDLLRLSSRLQQQQRIPLLPLARLGMADLKLSELPPPPPPPESFETEAAAPVWPWFDAEQRIPASPASALELSLAWIPSEQRRGAAADPASVEMRRRQLWLTPSQATAINALWERGQRSSQGPDGLRAQEGWQWRLVPEEALQRLGLPPRAHGFTLLDGRQLQIVWRQKGQTWLLRLPPSGPLPPLTNP